jgi:hypothetical protein
MSTFDSLISEIESEIAKFLQSENSELLLTETPPEEKPTESESSASASHEANEDFSDFSVEISTCCAELQLLRNSRMKRGTTFSLKKICSLLTDSSDKERNIAFSELEKSFPDMNLNFLRQIMSSTNEEFGAALSKIKIRIN